MNWTFFKETSTNGQKNYMKKFSIFLAIKEIINQNDSISPQSEWLSSRKQQMLVRMWEKETLIN
jgi:hypothetical protein